MRIPLCRAYAATRGESARRPPSGLDSHCVGFMGFSAGGEAAPWVAFGPNAGDPNAADPVDLVDGRRDFLVQFLPRPARHFGSASLNLPPAFLVQHPHLGRIES